MGKTMEILKELLQDAKNDWERFMRFWSQTVPAFFYRLWSRPKWEMVHEVDFTTGGYRQILSDLINEARNGHDAFVVRWTGCPDRPNRGHDIETASIGQIIRGFDNSAYDDYVTAVQLWRQSSWCGTWFKLVGLDRRESHRHLCLVAADKSETPSLAWGSSPNPEGGRESAIVHFFVSPANEPPASLQPVLKNVVIV